MGTLRYPAVDVFKIPVFAQSNDDDHRDVIERATARLSDRAIAQQKTLWLYARDVARGHREFEVTDSPMPSLPPNWIPIAYANRYGHIFEGVFVR